MAIVELRATGCTVNAIVVIDTSNEDTQRAMQTGASLTGTCYKIRQKASFDIQELFGSPIDALCQKANCRFHVKP
jgi:hypothetical protein